MARKYEELVGEFDYIERKYPASDGQFKILPGRLEDDTQVVGYCREDELQTGLTYLFRGYWTVHPRFGRQFQFHSFGVSQPVGQRGTVAYLTRGPGIGRKRAQLIWKLYGQDALDAIRDRPEEVAAKVNGLTTDRAKEAAAYFRAHKDKEIVTRDLEELLGGGGFPRRLIGKLIEKWGARAAEIVRGNPFVLVLFSGVGQGRADRLYLQLGGDPAEAERLGWCAWSALHKDRDGSTWKPLEFGRQAITKGIAGVDAKPEQGIEWAVKARHIAMRRDGAGRVWIAERERAAAEARLANQVHRAMMEGVGT